MLYSTPTSLSKISQPHTQIKMSIPRLQGRSSMQLPRLSLAFRPRHRQAGSATDDKGKGKKDHTDPETVEDEPSPPEAPEAEHEPEPEPGTKEAKSKAAKMLLKLKQSWGSPRGSSATSPKEEATSPIAGSRTKKGLLPQLADKMGGLFREPLDGGHAKLKKKHDDDHHGDNDELPEENGRDSHTFALLAGRQSYERALLFRPATSLGVRLSTSSDRAPLLAQAQLPSRGPTPWPGANPEQYEGRRSFNVKRKPVPLTSTDLEALLAQSQTQSQAQSSTGTTATQPEGRRSFNIRRKPVPLFDLHEETECDEDELEPQMQVVDEPEAENNAQLEAPLSDVSSVEFPMRPQVEPTESSALGEDSALDLSLPRRPRRDALIPTRDFRPITDGNPFIDDSDDADNEWEEETVDGPQWARRSEYLAACHSRRLEEDQNRWPAYPGLTLPAIRPQVDMFPPMLSDSPLLEGVLSPDASGSSGGTPVLAGLGIALNLGSGTFGVETGDSTSPASQNSPVSPTDNENAAQQPLTPEDTANEEHTFSAIAALLAVGGEGREDEEGDAASDWHEVVCV